MDSASGYLSYRGWDGLIQKNECEPTVHLFIRSFDLPCPGMLEAGNGDEQNRQILPSQSSYSDEGDNGKQEREGDYITYIYK